MDLFQPLQGHLNLNNNNFQKLSPHNFSEPEKTFRKYWCVASGDCTNA